MTGSANAWPLGQILKMKNFSVLRAGETDNLHNVGGDEKVQSEICAA